MADWLQWQASWDRQQEAYLPDREERFAAMLDALSALCGPAPRVLDLACGPASITSRVLLRLPEASVVGVDLDPALLAIAHGVHDTDERVRLVTADLRVPAWSAELPETAYDAILTATALHWLPETELARLYAELARLLRRGGLFCNADHMPLSGAPTLSTAVNASTAELQAIARAASDALDWDGWWAAAAAAPELKSLVEQRHALFGGATHPAEFTPPAAWHVGRLRAAGFAEAAVIWRDRADAVVAAVR